MSMLDRYKKGNGIVDLVKLVEDSPDAKRVQLLNMVRAEDPEFAAKVEARVLNWEKVRALPEGAIAEVISATAPKFIAMSLVGETAEFVALAEKCLGKLYNEYKQERENFTATPPNQSQIDSARRKMVGEARKLDTSGAIKIPIGEAVAGAASSGGMSTAPTNGAPGVAPTSNGQSQANVNTVINGPQGTARAEDGCPPIDSFKFEAPPPGLSGERLETYLKSMLGF